jgi:thiaminase
VKFQHSVLNDSAYMVRYVRAIVIWIFHRNAFKLLLCDLLQYQNHKNFPITTLPKHCSILPLCAAAGCVGCLKTL